MLSFFRKYNRILLVVFGSFLMVIFLLPAKGKWSDPTHGSDIVGSTADGYSFTLNDERSAQAEIEILKSTLRRNDRIMPTDGGTWLLLMHEAQKNGIYVSDEQAQMVVKAMVDQGMPVELMLRQLRITEDQLLAAIQHSRMFDQLCQLWIGASVVSEPRVKHEAVETSSSVSIEMAPVDASYVADKLPDPSDAEITEQFNKFKSAKPGSTEPYGFGYYQPNRVKLSYIAVPLEAVKKSLTIDEVAAVRYYQDHPERFMPPAPPAPQPDKDGKTPPPPPAPKGPQPYAEVREKVLKEVTDREATKKQEQIVKWIGAAMNDPLRQVHSGNDGYLQIPADFKPANLEDIAKEAQKQFGVLPTVVRIDDRFLARKDINELKGLGEASVTVGNGSIGAADYAMVVKELNPPANPTVAVLHYQLHVPSRVLTGEDGTQYILRVDAADAAHEPKSVDEPGVKQQVVRDIKRAKAFEQLKGMSQEMLSAARAAAKVSGLAKFAETFKTKVELAGPFVGREMRMKMFGMPEVPVLPAVGSSNDFVNAVFTFARKVEDAGGKDKAPVDMLFDVIPDAKSQKVVIVKLVDYKPVDSETFRRELMGVVNFLDIDSVQQIKLGQVMKRENVEKRTGWKAAEGYGSRKKPGSAPVNDAPASPFDADI
jgi:hypothetical protein